MRRRDYERAANRLWQAIDNVEHYMVGEPDGAAGAMALRKAAADALLAACRYGREDAAQTMRERS